MERAAIVAGLFQLGGTFGGLMVAGLMDRFKARRHCPVLSHRHDLPAVAGHR
ncbi:hypothetical protein [Rouxiella badensis]|uniref:hypothetical protein n=1 Tax=Rouxiella badensis TaxID=1646377 RepID=UPI001CE3C5E5|nr:hypothetical protein [Rouxiella badensis]